MKKIFQMFIVGLAFCFATNAKATSSVDPSCVLDGSCVQVCNYTQTTEGESQKNRSISIYYYHDGNWQIKWDAINNTGSVMKSKKESFSNLKNDNSVIFKTGITEDRFKCPTYGYIDTSSLNGGNEVCFDDNGTSCKSISNVGTSFGKDTAGNKFISTKNDYDYTTDLNKYFSEWDKALDLKVFIGKNKEEVKEIVDQEMTNSVEKNYLHGNKVPEFIYNTSAYKNAHVKAMNRYSKLIEDGGEVDQNVESGKLTEEEGNQIKESLNDAKDTVSEGVKVTLEDLKEPQKPESGTIKNTDVTKVGICSGESLRAFQIVGYVLVIIKILVPLVLIILASVDFAKAVFSSTDKLNTAVIQTLIRRVSIAIIIFLIPTVLDFLLSLVDGAEDVANDASFIDCTHCIFDPFGDCDTTPIDFDE